MRDLRSLSVPTRASRTHTLCLACAGTCPARARGMDGFPLQTTKQKHPSLQPTSRGVRGGTPGGACRQGCIVNEGVQGMRTLCCSQPFATTHHVLPRNALRSPTRAEPCIPRALLRPRPCSPSRRLLRRAAGKRRGRGRRAAGHGDHAEPAAADGWRPTFDEQVCA